MEIPEDLKYTPTHEWVRISGETATIGITHFAVEQLSDLTFIEFPEVGSRIQKSSRFGEIESVKTVADLFAPLSGEVLEVNEGLNDTIETISDSPYEKGWLVRLSVADASELESLLSASDYAAELEKEH